MEKLTFLFIPVSATTGIGEYNRSLMIATELQKRFPKADIHFIVNQHVTYAQNCPFSVIQSNGSATKDNQTVIKIIKSLKPKFVLFDASGRAKQMKVARDVGAKVGFISQHEKKRARGLQLNRIFNIDKHWVVQPDFAIEPLSRSQKTKLKITEKLLKLCRTKNNSLAKPKNIGAVFTSSPTALQEKNTYLPTENNFLFAESLDLNEPFVLFNAGSGGHQTVVDGKAIFSIDVFYQAALSFSKQTGIKSVVVFGDNYPQDLPQGDDLVKSDLVTCIKSVDNASFIELLKRARGRVISGGDTLLQSIALNLPCLAVAVTKDQPKRINSCRQHQLCLTSELLSESIVEQTIKLLSVGTEQQLIENMKPFQMPSALSIIVEDICELIIQKESAMKNICGAEYD